MEAENVELEDGPGLSKNRKEDAGVKWLHAVFDNKWYLIGLAVLVALTIVIVGAGIGIIYRTTDFKEETFDRLPNDIRPEAYVVEIHTFFENYTFHTRVNITFQIHSPTKYIILNAYKLENLSASLSGGLLQNDVPISRPRMDVIRLTPLTDLQEDNYTLTMECDGYITDDLLGLYRSRYGVDDTIYPYLLTTKFESSNARRVFPCWDEPSFKATFTIILIGPSSQQYVGNMPIAELEPYGENEVKVTFQKTPLMSTYLIAFVIGQLSQIEDADSFGTVQRVIVPKGSVGNGSLALKTSIQSIGFLSVYFKRFFPLPKLDMVAVKDFQSGAMEHWGMVTYREARLLPSEDSPLESQVGVVTTVCHENAHMWFGDLVTMRWWSDLWLNEGFATWIETFTSNYLHPEFDMWNRFLVEEVKGAMLLDSQRSTHPIIVDVPNTDNVNAIYDAISYRKGASVLRMLDEFVGTAVFRDALQNYIEKYAYQNTVTGQLWEEVSLASNQNISDVMFAWTSRPGFPYVQVTETVNSGDALTITVVQNRFFADGSAADEFQTVWKIPLTVCAASQPHEPRWSFLMENKTEKFQLVGAQSERWIKLNVGKASFIITLYPTEMLQALEQPVRDRVLSSLDRFDLESDLYMLASAGHVQMSRYLDFCLLFVNDDSVTIWRDIAGNVDSLGVLVVYMTPNATINAYGLKLFEPLYGRIGWTPGANESQSMSALRAVAFENAGIYGDKNAIRDADQNFDGALTNSNFPADLREPVFIVEARQGGKAAYDKIKSFYLNAKTSDEQRMALVAMGHTLEESCMLDIFNMILQTGEIRLQDIFYPLRGIGSTKKGRDFAWQFTVDNIVLIKQVIPLQYIIEDYITILFTGYGTTDVIPEMEQLFKTNEIPLDNIAIVQLFDKIRANADEVARSGDDVVSYLNNIKSKRA